MPVPRPDRKKVEKAVEDINGQIEAINQTIAGIDAKTEDIKKQFDAVNDAKTGQNVSISLFQ